MIRFLAIAAFLVCLMGPCGDAVVGVIGVGYEARASNARLAVAVAQGGGAEIVTIEEYETPGEQR